jgi:hypothetical protein
MTASKALKMSLITVMIFTLLSFDLPTGWYAAGSSSSLYKMGIDKGAGEDGKNAATIKSKAKKISGFGTLMQACSAESYRGKRIRMSGLMKTEDVKRWAGLWLRVDDKFSDNYLSFDNMKSGKIDRSIKGTTAWKRYEIVLDVPVNSSNLAYGALINGTGQIWFDQIQFEVVDLSVPTTGKDEFRTFKEPVNLDFED